MVSLCTLLISTEPHKAQELGLHPMLSSQSRCLGLTIFATGVFVTTGRHAVALADLNSKLQVVLAQVQEWGYPQA